MPVTAAPKKLAPAMRVLTVGSELERHLDELVTHINKTDDLVQGMTTRRRATVRDLDLMRDMIAKIKRRLFDRPTPDLDRRVQRKGRKLQMGE